MASYVAFPSLNLQCIRGQRSLIFSSFNKHLLKTQFGIGTMLVARDREKKVSSSKLLTIQERDRKTITIQPEKGHDTVDNRLYGSIYIEHLFPDRDLGKVY